MAGELQRAESSLTRAGALDGDGDITEIGYELKRFRGDIRDAELMMNADKFACAYEMSFVLPLMELAQNDSLLHFDKEWSSGQKAIVRERQRHFTASCRDDLEFGLKAVDCWMRARQGEMPHLVHSESWQDCWKKRIDNVGYGQLKDLSRSCLLYTSPSPRDRQKSRMPSSA